ncbi:MAG: hypothetical protein IIC13_13680 [SAR324 cluster bacterium]|nr:hypothetical protein [SAR324 cluster bacterium]MCH8887631.1 hypothetical protein [SAR324 cluster bacterium]
MLEISAAMKPERSPKRLTRRNYTFDSGAAVKAVQASAGSLMPLPSHFLLAPAFADYYLQL